MGDTGGIRRHGFESDAECVFTVRVADMDVPGTGRRVGQFVEGGTDLLQHDDLVYRVTVSIARFFDVLLLLIDDFIHDNSPARITQKFQAPSTKFQTNPKSQYSNGMYGQRFEILNLVIVICLFFGICDLGFTYHPVHSYLNFIYSNMY